jgi:uncharacterized protein YkwD
MVSAGPPHAFDIGFSSAMRKHFYVVGSVALVTAVAGIAVAASASAGTTTYEAEAATNSLTGGAHVASCGRCSGGSRVTGLGLLGELTFTRVASERAGATKLAVTYTSTEIRTAQISVNGGVATAVSFPATRGEGRTGTLRTVVTLTSGDNTVTFGNPTGVAPDIDKLVITTDGTPPTLAPTVPASGEPGVAATASESAPPTLPTSPPPSSNPAPVRAGSGNVAFESQVVALVNAERVRAGCKSLAVDARLTAAARGHSNDMAARDYFSHTSPDGVEFATRISNASYKWSGVAENIAKGPPAPGDVMTSWLTSAGHKANIVNCGYRNIGVGVAADAAGTLLWTQDFGTPL